MNLLEYIDMNELADMRNRIVAHIEQSKVVSFTHLLESHLKEIETEIKNRKLNN